MVYPCQWAPFPAYPIGSRFHGNGKTPDGTVRRTGAVTYPTHYHAHLPKISRLCIVCQRGFYEFGCQFSRRDPCLTYGRPGNDWPSPSPAPRFLGLRHPCAPFIIGTHHKCMGQDGQAAWIWCLLGPAGKARPSGARITGTQKPGTGITYNACNNKRRPTPYPYRSISVWRHRQKKGGIYGPAKVRSH